MKEQISNKPFLTAIQELRDHAREQIRQGAVTPDYQGDLKTAHDLLNGALATELVCVLRYRYHYYMAEGLLSDSIKAEFLQHAQEEYDHADLIAKRIVQLNGKPNLNPSTLLERSAAEYQEGEDIVEMIEENLIAERIAIEHYRELIEYFGYQKDPTTRSMLEGILATEEEHAEDMATLLSQVKSTQSEHEQKTA